jgi:hypothetical protein
MNRFTAHQVTIKLVIAKVFVYVLLRGDCRVVVEDVALINYLCLAARGRSLLVNIALCF